MAVTPNFHEGAQHPQMKVRSTPSHESTFTLTHGATNMLTMTSLVAQNQFGSLIDASQRQPVTVTRRGRPVMVTMSYEDYIQRTKTIPYEVFKLISTNFPLRGQDAVHAMRSMLDSLPNTAVDEGLTEEDVMRMLNEEQ